MLQELLLELLPPTSAMVLRSAGNGSRELVRDEAELVLLGNGGKTGDGGASARFYAVVTAALLSQQPRVGNIFTGPSQITSIPSRKFSLSQQCYFLQAAHFRRVGDAGIRKLWLEIFFALRRFEKAKQTNQTER